MHSIYGFCHLVGHYVFSLLLFAHPPKLDWHASCIIFSFDVDPPNNMLLIHFILCFGCCSLGLCCSFLYLTWCCVSSIFLNFSCTNLFQTLQLISFTKQGFLICYYESYSFGWCCFIGRHGFLLLISWLVLQFVISYLEFYFLTFCLVIFGGCFFIIIHVFIQIYVYYIVLVPLVFVVRLRMLYKLAMLQKLEMFMLFICSIIIYTLVLSTVLFNLYSTMCCKPVIAIENTRQALQ